MELGPAFIALGYSNFNLKYSFKEIETLLSGQWDDGMVPHILFHKGYKLYPKL